MAINGASAKGVGLSPKAAGAAPFKPKGAAGISSLSQGRFMMGSGVWLNLTKSVGSNEFSPLAKKQYNPNAPDWSMATSSSDGSEYLPQSHGMSSSLVSFHFIFFSLYTQHGSTNWCWKIEYTPIGSAS